MMAVATRNAANQTASSAPFTASGLNTCAGELTSPLHVNSVNISRFMASCLSVRRSA